MKLRLATEADQQVLRELWEEFEAEIPAPPEFVETWDEEWKDVAADIGGRGVVYLAEDDDGVAGAVRATMLSGHVWHIVFAHVRRRARRRGLLKRLMTPVLDEGRGRGATRVTLDVMSSNHSAVTAWKRNDDAGAAAASGFRIAGSLNATPQAQPPGPGESRTSSVSAGARLTVPPA